MASAESNEVSKHIEMSKLFITIKTNCQMLEEAIYKHYRSGYDIRIKSIQKINKELNVLRQYLASNKEDATTDLYYT